MVIIGLKADLDIFFQRLVHSSGYIQTPLETGYTLSVWQ